MPWPDSVAVNGPSMRAISERAGYPAPRMLDVEALRFLHLNEAHAREARGGGRRVLVLGEYSLPLTHFLVGMVHRAVALDPRGIEVALRPHPTAVMGDEDSLIPRDRHRNLRDALRWSDVAVCGVHSSAVVEAAALGLPTAVVADPTAFPSSPGEGMRNVQFVSTPESLLQFLHSGALAMPHDHVLTAGPHLLDTDLTRWARCLAARPDTRTD